MVYVVRGLQTLLLGRQAIQGLRISGQVNHNSKRRIDIKNAHTSFLSFFSGFEKFKGLAHNISLREDAIPYSLAALRRVPLPLMPRVEADLQRMESDEILESIDEPTKWCSGIMVFPNLIAAFASVQNSRTSTKGCAENVTSSHQMEHLLATIQEANTISKLNANTAFYQIPLAEASQPHHIHYTLRSFLL